MSFFSKLFFLSLVLLPFFSFTQSDEDLAYLNLLPESQIDSISSKLGIQTGKPVDDVVRMYDFDDPSFDSSEPKTKNDLVNEVNLFSQNSKKVFGLDLFKESPSTFAPIDLAPAPLEYTLGLRRVKIQLFGSIKVNRIAPINREGNLIIPEIGSLEISGLSFREAKNKINLTISASLIGVTAEISLAKIRSIQIFVLGNAFSPIVLIQLALYQIYLMSYFFLEDPHKMVP